MEKIKCVICGRWKFANDFKYKGVAVCQDCGEEIAEDNPYVFVGNSFKGEETEHGKNG